MFKKDDRVRVVSQSALNGTEGVVYHHYRESNAYLVTLDGSATRSGFFEDELELVKVRLEVNLSSVEEGYNVVVDLTDEEAEGVRKFVAAAQAVEEAKGVQFGPVVRLL
jgi:hypothetical protein